MNKYLSSRKDLKMLTLIDFGCGQHPRCQLTLTGSMAALVSNLVINLPLKGDYHTYICEYGHTHCLLLYPHEDDMAIGSTAGKLAKGRVPPSRPG
jgi:hypothetical protein